MKKLILLNSAFIIDMLNKVVEVLNEYQSDVPTQDSDIEDLVNRVLELFSDADEDKLDKLIALVGDDMLDTLIELACDIQQKISSVLGEEMTEITQMGYSAFHRAFVVAIKQRNKI